MRSTYDSPTTGDKVGVSFLIPRTIEDLEHRRAGIQVWAEYSNGFLGRTGDYMNSSLTALAAAEKWFSQAGPEYGERIRKYYELARENDLLATHTLIPPQVNRSVSGSEQLGGQLSARIVEEREDGIVINGARMLATIGPIADELLVFPSTVLRGTPEDAPYSYAFAIQNDAPGLRYLCRTSLHNGGSTFDEPLAARFEEMDAVVVFDNVFVPNERIFMLGHPDLCNAFYSETGAAALMTQQVVTRTIAKSQFFLGTGHRDRRGDRHRRVPAHPGGARRAHRRRRDRQGADARIRGGCLAQPVGHDAAQVGDAQRRPQLVPEDRAALPADHPHLLRQRADGAARARPTWPATRCRTSSCTCRASRSPGRSGSSCSSSPTTRRSPDSPRARRSTSTSSSATRCGWPARW